MQHLTYLTEGFFLWIEITPHISLDTRKVFGLWSDGLYVLFMSSEHLLVRMSKIIRLPQDSCLTGCKWTPKSGLKTTCQSSPPPEESFTTSAEVSWVTKDLVLEKEWWGSTLDTFFKKQTWKKNLMHLKSFLIQVVSSSHSFWWIFWHCCSLWLLVDKTPWVTGGSCQLEGKSLTTNKCSLTHSRHSMSHCVLCVCECVCLYILFYYILLYFPLYTHPTENVCSLRNDYVFYIPCSALHK